MPIELLEAGSVQSALTGWMGSRDLDAAPSADHVAAIDASVNELPTALFYFRDMMILERELFVTPRNHVIWARTSRVDDPRDFTVLKGFEREEHKAIKAMMHQLAGDGVPQDKWRLELPLCACTSWTARISLRDWIRHINYLYNVAAFIGSNNKPLANRLNAVAGGMVFMATKAYGLDFKTVGHIVDTYKGGDVHTASDWGKGDVRKTFGEFVHMQLTLPIAARAQLARHREIMVVDQFVDLLSAANSEQLNIGTPCVVQATALASTWRHVLGNRTCWMAQADLWAPLATLYGGEVAALPCAEGVCPYAEDAKQRLAGRDPGAPCPRYSALTDEPMQSHQYKAAEKEAAEKPNREMWWREFDAVRVEHSS